MSTTSAPTAAPPASAMDDGWAELRQSYLNIGLTLVLGAGVSFASGIPNWEQLIERLLQHTDIPGRGQTYAQLREVGFSPTTITQYVKNNMSDSDYIAAIKDALYLDFPCRDVLYCWQKEGAATIAHHVHTQNKTLKAVYDLATTPTHDFIKPNWHIPAIINFNIDSLLEAYDTACCCNLREKTEDRCLHKIEGAATRRIVNRTSVYHPHGYLRFEKEPGIRDESRTQRCFLNTSTMISTINRLSCLHTRF